MTIAALAEKLREMRTDAVPGNVDVMTRLFGVIFCDEIGNRSGQIVEEYRRQNWPGSPAETVIQDARKLAQFVDPHYNVVRKWRG